MLTYSLLECQPEKLYVSSFFQRKRVVKVTKINVGVVGLGEIAQIIHLPLLQDHSDRFEIAAICDISQELLSAMGERYTVPAEHRYTDYHDVRNLPPGRRQACSQE